jgi:selenocysteine-specific elongation factor
MTDPVHVVATAGHVDHGKSSLIIRLTGMDPDRWEEEKRRGLTIDLGFAWTVLPSGAEVGFVDVPGHERFVRNMLAGVGPVRLVLFVVAADEGWKPQSEEHLQILDVLGVDGAVIALTKTDQVDEEILGTRQGEIAARVKGTRLEGSSIVPVSARTGFGLDELRRAIDAMVLAAPAPERSGRPRLFVDRVFTIRGAGTVVTGTLTGGDLDVGREVQLMPAGHRARVRSLQTHRRAIRHAQPVSRVAVNLTGLDRAGSHRGDVLGLPGQWRSTDRFEGLLQPVRGLAHALTDRGAYKLYAGSAEREARVRLYGTKALEPDGEAFVRVTLTRPVVLDVGDRFVLREAGRRETVAGGTVLDAFPPDRAGPEPEGRLRLRVGGDRASLAARVVSDQGAVRSSDVMATVGAEPAAAVSGGAIVLGDWLADPSLVDALTKDLLERIEREHAEHPLREGLDVNEARSHLASRPGAPDEAGFDDALLARMTASGLIERAGAAVRIPGYASPGRDTREADALVEAVAAAEPSPPSVKELAAAGHSADLIRSVCAEGRLVRIGPDMVVTSAFLARAEAAARELAGTTGRLTVSGFREALGTSRKYALPVLDYFDRRGFTRRQGDVRTVRG